ncbi:MAG: 4Fe-4S dicluster domain-containing protein [Candidatus Cloacimonetes bacterium]|nr:4Fe-4S dicluster domain-containing protein [Candidatus Cloacimonadota bacterium]
MYKFKIVYLPEFLEYLQEKYTLWAPAKSGTETEFKVISSFAEIDQSRLNTTLNPKEIFFPRREVLFSYDENGIKTPPPPEKPVAVWGLRTCDTRSIRMLDEVFSNAHQMPEKEMFKDPYWINKYADSLLISQACRQPLSTCFCNWFNSGPFDETGSDIFVIKGEVNYYLKGISDKGQEVLAGFAKAEQTDEKDAAEIKDLQAAAESYMSPALDISDLKSKLDKIWDDPLWEEIGAKCINCGACAYICPTCHCFDVSDEGKAGKGKRVRLWDACMFQLFTKEASGHNPRSNSLNRVRQRVMHKYNYFVDNYQKFLCTGCGRCVSVCPVNMDIREIIKKILAHEI